MKTFLEELSQRVSTEFENTADTYFTGTEQEEIQEEIQNTRDLLRHFHILPMIGNEGVTTGGIIESVVNPSDTKEVLVNIFYAGIGTVECAVALIKKSPRVAEWKHKSLTDRSLIIDRAADLIESKRRFFISLMILEVGKHPEDADKEISEAIDLLRLYAAEARIYEEFANKSIVSPAGEKNTTVLGSVENPAICVSIQPWNFPLAISTGPMSAALLSGYAVLYKPAEESSIIGYFLADIMYEAGIPREVLYFLPGKGEVIGARLVDDKDTKVFCFTGSSLVGRKIERAVTKFNLDILPTLPRKDRYRKRIASMETGGNNVLIVDRSAERTEAIRAVLRSAFSFAGQKCSALQRLVIVDDGTGFYESFTDDLKEAIQEIRVGSPEDFGTFYGPVINQAAYVRIISVREKAWECGAKITEGVLRNGTEDGYFIPPFLIEGLPNGHELVQQELFGPGLFVLRAKTIEEAVEMANDTEYALTGGICSRNELYMEYVRENLVVGNYYENKPIVGARVLCQPFGGMKESGGFGFKAGGVFYLLNFLCDARAFSRNTMRQGIPLDSQ
jgi:RHH-type proline utilization regulon transcriptional repressor/proline dehydrogenase/delta 1-pyrroline-5-carboxylate dehydrogenase